MRINGCEYPAGLLYDLDAGTWIRREGDSYVVGVAPSLSWRSGGFEKARSKPPGTTVAFGKSLGEVEGPRHFDVVRAPFDCVVEAGNERLRLEPRLINKDPYGEGWFVRLKRTGGEDHLSEVSDAADQIAKRLEELGVRCFAEFPDFEMYEIGVECSAVLVRLGEELGPAPPGTVVHVVSDDPAAEIEMERWTEQTGNTLVETRPEARLRHFIVKKP